VPQTPSTIGCPVARRDHHACVNTTQPGNVAYPRTSAARAQSGHASFAGSSAPTSPPEYLPGTQRTDAVLVPNMLSPDRSCHTPTTCLPFCGHDRSLEGHCRFDVGALLAASIECRICRLPVVRSDVCIETCVTELAQGVMKSTACVMNSHSAS